MPRLDSLSRRPRIFAGWRTCTGIALLLAALAAAARADTVTIRDSDSSVLPYADVQINSVTNGQITFTMSSGERVTKPFAHVVDLSLDDQPGFNQAEADLSANRLDRAIDEFNQVIASTDKPWLKAFCQGKLIDAASKDGRFDLVVQAYTALVMSDPTLAQAHHQPAVPPDSSYLNSAAQSLATAADAPGITQQQQSMLLAFLLEIDRARKDDAGVAAVAARLSGDTGSGGSPAASSADLALADAKLTQAKDQLSKHQYDQAAQTIEGAKTLFTDPGRQADALYELAQARQGQAEASNDANAWKDAAIAYLRVVADFHQQPGAPHVADAMLRAGEMMEKLSQPEKAKSLYQSVVKDFPGSPAAADASAAIARLKAAQ